MDIWISCLKNNLMDVDLKGNHVKWSYCDRLLHEVFAVGLVAKVK